MKFKRMDKETVRVLIPGMVQDPAGASRPPLPLAPPSPPVYRAADPPVSLEAGLVPQSTGSPPSPPSCPLPSKGYEYSLTLKASDLADTFRRLEAQAGMLTDAVTRTRVDLTVGDKVLIFITRRDLGKECNYAVRVEYTPSKRTFTSRAACPPGRTLKDEIEDLNTAMKQDTVPTKKKRSPRKPHKKKELKNESNST